MHTVKQSSFQMVVPGHTDLFWLAGLLEGEGSFIKGPPSSPRCPIVELSMTDVDVVEGAARLFGRAVTSWDRNSTQPLKRVYATRIKGTPATVVMRDLYPLMGARRRGQIASALSGPVARGPRSRLGEAADGLAAAERRASSLADVPGPALVSTPPGDPRSIAWLAGLLEGEGTFARARGYPHISVTMCDRDVLERAAAIMGIPHVWRKNPQASAEHGWSQAFQVGTMGSRAAHWMRQLRPLMGQRRGREIDLALVAYRPRRLTKAPQHCVVADCTDPHRSRGLCHKHYMKWYRDRRSGKPTRVAPLR